MITQYHVQNFKNLVNIRESFHPQPLNVIVGPNGCGKTSLFQSIDFLRAFFMSSIELYLQEKGWEMRELVNIHSREIMISQKLKNGRTNNVRVMSSSAEIHWTIWAELHEDSHGYGKGKYTYLVSLSTQTLRNITEQLSFIDS